MDTKQKVQKFLDEFEMPKEKLCRRLGISRQTMYQWLNGQLNLSTETVNRIEKYMRKYDSILTDAD